MESRSVPKNKSKKGFLKMNDFIKLELQHIGDALLSNAMPFFLKKTTGVICYEWFEV